MSCQDDHGIHPGTGVMSWLMVSEFKKGLVLSNRDVLLGQQNQCFEKINEIPSAEELIENLGKSGFSEDYRHFSARFSCPRDGSSDLRIESPI